MSRRPGHALAQTWLAMTDFYSFRFRNVTLTTVCSRQVAPGWALNAVEIKIHEYNGLNTLLL